jgi:hypothetical protein
MCAKSAPIDGDKKKAGCSQRSAQAEDAEIPDLDRIELSDAGRALRQHQGNEHAERSHCTVGGDQQPPDVKENGVHWRQDKTGERGSKGARAKQVAELAALAGLVEEGTEIRPTGP